GRSPDDPAWLLVDTLAEYNGCPSALIERALDGADDLPDWPRVSARLLHELPTLEMRARACVRVWDEWHATHTQETTPALVPQGSPQYPQAAQAMVSQPLTRRGVNSSVNSGGLAVASVAVVERPLEAPTPATPALAAFLAL
ncbi:MAG TPA: hypothetical protein VMV29_01315, partial [Ktedonobacterales bacterium]|nr:hypothetical protein [Ktedonobacterales bacterium]